ncbi:YraN family protein [Carboxydothermus pertinax]|uniref:UPF0102 protein cpu_21670 n=1 Tax=Carboxydothermus pertinax TaxID=870242 RepID=A0A1L8CXN9_9THEO|nr:YraN family protein [Carboxydothermus pertinax]GAV23657.1 hypothetical protein cpu_21670 [Carboxydothermus pertinax]
MNRRELGQKWEELAEQYLERKGYQILNRNYQIRGGEIDIIAQEGEFLVFIEVRYRSDISYGTPSETVSKKKKAALKKAIKVYIHQNYLYHLQPRVDLIGIERTAKGFLLNHYQNVIDF